MELSLVEKELPSGIILHFAENNNIQDFFTYLGDYDFDSSAKLKNNEFFCSVRGLKGYTHYTVIPNNFLLKILSEFINVNDIQFHIHYTSKNKGFLMAKDISKYTTVYLSELRKLEEF
jgi:hypothetical protein